MSLIVEPDAHITLLNGFHASEESGKNALRYIERCILFDDILPEARQADNLKLPR